jgi:hypothetical protein
MGKRRESVCTPKLDSSGSPVRIRPHNIKRIVERPGHAHYGGTSACDTVLHIPELLERILSHLAPQKIFTLQRVSRLWKEVITVSPELQGIMFLRQQLSRRPLEIWEAVDPQAKRVTIDMADGVGPYHECNCNLKIRMVVHVQDDANGDDNRMLFLPVALNPLMERGKPARRPLVAVDGQGVSCAVAISSTERVSYRGTMALLKQYSAMYLTHPPTLEADLKVIVYYRDACASPTVTPGRAELLSVKVESSTGLKLQDLIEGVHSGKSVGCEIFGYDEPDLHSRGRVIDIGDWDRLRQETTLAGLEDSVREVYGWNSAFREPTFQLEMLLEASAWGGLVPIVPTAEERRAVAKG